MHQDTTNWAAIAIIAAAELAVLFGATVRCFTARARMDRERDSDIRGSIAGYEEGIVIPALAELVTTVNQVRERALERGEDVPPLEDVLGRADTGQAFDRAVDAASRSRIPRTLETSLIHRYTALGVSLIACHIAGPAALYNVLTAGYNLPHSAVIAAAVVFVVGAAGTLVLATLVGIGESALARSIREGKDAA